MVFDRQRACRKKGFGGATFVFLFFSKEILQDLSKQSEFSHFMKRYNVCGYHTHNEVLFGDDCDFLYFTFPDAHLMPYENIRDQLDSFTLHLQPNPCISFH